MPLYQILEVTNIELAIDQLDIKYRLYIANFFLLDLGSFEHRYGYDLETRSNISMVHFIFLVIKLISSIQSYTTSTVHRSLLK